MLSERFLEIYNEELRFLRESGKQFADENPQVASQLGMHSDSVLDPFVERLLEGSAFLSARVQEKLRSESPEFALQMLTRLAPFWYAPIPSIATISIVPDLTSPQWQKPLSLPKGSEVSLSDSSLNNKQATFTTGSQVDIQPVLISYAECVGAPSIHLPELVRGPLRKGQACIRLRFTTQGVVPVSQLSFSPLQLTMAGDAVRSNQLLTLLLNHCEKIIVWCEDEPRPVIQVLDSSSLTLGGLDSEEALLPQYIGEIPGTRLLREYFSSPSRFYNVQLEGLNSFFQRCHRQHEFEIIFSLDHVPLSLVQRITAADFRLFTTPVVNLYHRRCDPVVLEHCRTDHHLVVDKLNPVGYEIHHLLNVKGNLNDGSVVNFTSLPEDTIFNGVQENAIYSLQRKEIPYQKKLQSSALGYQDFFITISSGFSGVDIEEIKSLSIEAMVCDRFFFPQHLQNPKLQLKKNLPIESIELLRTPSVPRSVPSLHDAWRAIQWVAINPLRYVKPHSQNCANIVREWLSLFAAADDAGQRKRILSVTDVTVTPCFEHYKGAGPVAWYRGLQADVNVISAHHADMGAYLFGCILHAALSEYCQLNQTLRTQFRLDNDTVAEWGPGSV